MSDNITESDNPLVSVIMNCHNGVRHLREALDSVFAQTYTKFEIIFWDNASTDGSANTAHSYSDSRLRYFRGERKVPLGQARNFALAKATGELVAFLDCDDIWLPQKTEKQLPLFARAEVGLVYSDALFFNEVGEEVRLSTTCKLFRGHCFEALLNRYFISLESVVIRRSALDKMERWFDPNFNFIEEYDLFVRMGIDWELDYVPEVLAKWRVHSESLSWQFPQGFTEERRKMLIELQRSQKVVRSYYEALRFGWSIQLFNEAKLAWRRGQHSLARATLGRAAKPSAKHWAFYFLTFLSSNFVDGLYRRMRGAIGPKSRQ